MSTIYFVQLLLWVWTKTLFAAVLILFWNIPQQTSFFSKYKLDKKLNTYNVLTNFLLFFYFFSTLLRFHLTFPLPLHEDSTHFIFGILEWEYFSVEQILLTILYIRNSYSRFNLLISSSEFSLQPPYTVLWLKLSDLRILKKERRRESTLSRPLLFTVYCVQTLYRHSTLILHTLYTHCTYIVHTLYRHSTLILHTLYTHCTKHCTYTVQTFYTDCKHTVHTLYIHCTDTVHTLHRHCTHTINTLYIHCTDFLHWL